MTVEREGNVVYPWGKPEAESHEPLDQESIRLRIADIVLERLLLESEEMRLRSRLEPPNEKPR